MVSAIGQPLLKFQPLLVVRFTLARIKEVHDRMSLGFPTASGSNGALSLTYLESRSRYGIWSGDSAFVLWRGTMSGQPNARTVLASRLSSLESNAARPT